MRVYELVLVLKTSLSESARKKVLDQVKELLNDVKVTKEDEWGQKPLAYKIKRELAGFYHLMHLEGEAGIAKGFDKQVSANDNILRHLLIRKNDKK